MAPPIVFARFTERDVYKKMLHGRLVDHRIDWKLIYYHADRRFELFNLREDLGETNNLAEREPERLQALANELTEYVRRCPLWKPPEFRCRCRPTRGQLDRFLPTLTLKPSPCLLFS